jgi:hypothetical protein
VKVKQNERSGKEKDEKKTLTPLRLAPAALAQMLAAIPGEGEAK